jgi:hypothetical protein
VIEKRKPPVDAKAAPASPTTGYFLELYFPVTRAILPQHFHTESEAVRASFLHFTTFPKGYAQVRQIETNEVVLNHQQLYQRYLDRPRS